MNIVIREESHNRVEWLVKTPMPWIVLGLLVGWIVLLLLIGSTGASGRWTVIITTGVIVVAASAILGLRVPLSEHGHLQRTPEGGEIVRTVAWLIQGRRTLAQVALETVEGLRLQESSFHTGPEATAPLARLQADRSDGSPVILTDWADPQQVAALREALARAGRLALLPTQILSGERPVEPK